MHTDQAWLPLEACRRHREAGKPRQEYLHAQGSQRCHRLRPQRGRVPHAAELGEHVGHKLLSLAPVLGSGCRLCAGVVLRAAGPADARLDWQNALAGTLQQLQLDLIADLCRHKLLSDHTSALEAGKQASLCPGNRAQASAHSTGRRLTLGH